MERILFKLEGQEMDKDWEKLKEALEEEGIVLLRSDTIEIGEKIALPGGKLGIVARRMEERNYEKNRTEPRNHTKRIESWKKRTY